MGILVNLLVSGRDSLVTYKINSWEVEGDLNNNSPSYTLVAQLAEAIGLSPMQCEFESHQE